MLLKDLALVVNAPLLDDERVSMSAQIKESLKEMRLTQVWLVGELAKTGVNTDKSELCSILSGTRKGAKCDAILRLSISLLDAQRKKYG